MADIANLVLAIDSTSVPAATASLDGLAAAGARAETATVGLSGGFKGAGVEAAAMASAAQLSARAAVDQAAGFGAATNAARINTLALRESLVVAREISRGNFTRLPGSLTLLAQGIGSQGGFSAFASALSQQFGLIKKVQDAQLAETAAEAANAAASVEAAARKAGANILAADTEVALAQAQIRVAEGATAEAAAQARLAAANEAVAAASGEAAIAENALAVAQGRATEASAAAAAAARTTIGTTGAVLIGVTIAATGVVGAFKALQATVDDSGALDRYAQSLVKTKDQLKALEDKVGGFQITWGDVFHGLSKAAGDAIGSASMWDAFKEGSKNAFTDALHNAVNFAAESYGVVRGSYQTIVDDWSRFPAVLGDAFYSAVNIAIGALNKLVKFGTDQLNSLIASVNKLPGVNIGSISAPQIGTVANPYAGSKINSDLHGNISKYTAEGRSRINAGLETAYDDIVGAADARIKEGLGKGKKGGRGRHPKEAVDHADDQIARLDEQILGAKIALTKDATEEAALKVQELRIARDKTIMDAEALFRAHKITGPELEIITLRAQELDNLKEKAVLNARDIKLLEQDQAAQDQLFGFKDDALKAALAEAGSQAERRTLELQMLNISYEQKKYDLQILQEKQRIAGDLAGVALTQGKLDHLPTQFATDQAATLKKTQDPLHQWLDKIPSDAAAITEALQGIEVKGLDSLASSIAGIVTGTESMGKAFQNISRQIVGDIVQMIVKMLIFRALSSVFGGGIGGAGGGSSFGSIVSGARASGGPVMGGQTYIVGEQGPELFTAGTSGNITPNNQLAVTPNRPQAANSNSRQIVEVHVRTDENFSASVQQIAGTTIIQAAPIIIAQAGKATMKALSRPKITGGR